MYTKLFFDVLTVVFSTNQVINILTEVVGHTHTHIYRNTCISMLQMLQFTLCILDRLRDQSYLSLNLAYLCANPSCSRIPYS